MNQASNYQILFPMITGKGIQAEDVCSAASAETGRLLRAFPNGTKAGKNRWAALGKITEKSQQSIGVFRGKMLKPEEFFVLFFFFNPELSVSTWRPPPDGRGWRCLDANGAHMALRCGQEAGCG